MHGINPAIKRNLAVTILIFSLLAIGVHCFASGTEPLPKWITEAEKQQYGNTIRGETDDPPGGDIQSYPEWYPAEGVIIAWFWFDDYLTDLVEQFVQVGTSWIVVESYSQQISVGNTLTAAGISLDNVEFLIFDMDSVWMIDYAPFFVSVDGNMEIIDQLYGRPQDDLFPQRLGDAWSIPWHTSELWIEGGNFFADGLGTCFTTSILFENNPEMTYTEVIAQLENYCGCETVYVLDYLQDYTGHIDMFARLLDVDTMMIAQYEPGDPEYQILEDNAALVETLISGTGGPYEVVRIPMAGTPSEYLTYTNSLSVNQHMFVPIYNDPLDSTALDIYQHALPDYTIVGIDSLEPIVWGGAIHCTSKVVPSKNITPTPTPEPTATPSSPPTPSPTPVPTGTPTPVCIHHGDVNLDGELTSEDAQIAFYIAMGSTQPSEEERCAADCNGDGEVTAGDAQLIFMAVLGMADCVDSYQYPSG